MAWINSDDKYAPWAFSVVAEIFDSLPEVEWITSLYPLIWNVQGNVVDCEHLEGGFGREGFFKGANCDGLLNRYMSHWIQQESTFWRRSLWDKTGARLDVSYRLAADFELWACFFKQTHLYGVTCPYSGFRRHSQQKTASYLPNYLDEVRKVLDSYGSKPYGIVEVIIRHIYQTLFGKRIRARMPWHTKQPIIRYNKADGYWAVKWC